MSNSCIKACGRPKKRSIYKPVKPPPNQKPEKKAKTTRAKTAKKNQMLEALKQASLRFL
jgi:hypothetical protein